MADTEMTIRLVDASEEEQRAFNAEPQQNAPQPTPFPSPPDTSTKPATEPTVSETRQPIESRENATLLESLRDSLLDLTDRFAPDAFQRPLERLIEALTGRKPDRDTSPKSPSKVDAPPVQDRPHFNSTAKQFVTPPPIQTKDTDKKPNQAPDTATKRTRFDWIGRGRQLLARTRIGRKAIDAFDRVRPAATAAARAIGKTQAGRRIASMAKPLAKRFGLSVGTAAATTGAASAGAAGGASTGAAASAGVAAIANPVGLSVAAVVAGFVAVGVAAKVLADTFTSEAEKLRRVSSQIEIALSRRQMNTELNQLDRANKIGDGLGRFEMAKTNLQDQTEKLMTQILQLLIRFEPMLSGLLDATTLASLNLRERLAKTELYLAAINSTIADWTPNPNDDAPARQAGVDAAKALKQIQDEMAEFFRGSQIPTGPDPLLQQVMDMEFDRMGNPIKRGGNP